MAVSKAPRTTTAELKTTEGPITDEDLMRLPRDGRKWELVDGRLQEVATSAKHDQTVIWLGRLIGPYADDHGILTASQVGFRMASGNVRLPDFAFTRYDRFPNGEVPDGFVEFAPDLAVEIISPSEEPADMARKVGEYFESGAQQVWHMFPETRTVKAFRSPSEVRVYQPDEELDVSDLLPGFRSRVTVLFHKKGGVVSSFTRSPSQACNASRGSYCGCQQGVTLQAIVCKGDSPPRIEGWAVS